jgi:hypothetical protein
MGWFDKRSWKLRRKIKDLQADLRAAENEGKFVVEEGLFFAELQEMGDQTMLVFGTSDLLASQEESVIRAFLDRNGFTVDRLKIDRTHTHLSEVEIIPPEEMTRAVARQLKQLGYRVLDDSEEERKADLSRSIFTLSSLIRAISIMFAEHVQKVIATTQIKMNKEGNRLLHWMPKIIEALEERVSRDAIETCRDAFNHAYNQFYARIGKGREISPGKADSPKRPAAPEKPSPAAAKPSPAPARRPKPAPSPVPSPPPAPARAPRSPASRPKPEFQPYMPTPTAPDAEATPGPPDGAPQADMTRLLRRKELAETVADIYRSLVRANSSRCVRNSEAILDRINQLLDAAATCIMVKVPRGRGLTIHAQAGQKLVWGEGSGGTGFAVSATVVGHCIRGRKVVTNELSGGDPTASMVFHHIEATVAAPIIVSDEIVGILYVDRRGGLRPFTEEECEMVEVLSGIFEEFPDLTLGLVQT